LHGNSDGVQHTLVLDRVITPFGDATALLHLNGKRPSPSAAGWLAGAYQYGQDKEQYQLAAQLSGSLQELGIALTASGDKLKGHADVVATLLASVPLKRAKVDLQHINPQAFNAAAPAADLNLRADLAPRLAWPPTHRCKWPAVSRSPMPAPAAWTSNACPCSRPAPT
jgi:translocation and assembly module TamB